MSDPTLDIRQDQVEDLALVALTGDQETEREWRDYMLDHPPRSDSHRFYVANPGEIMPDNITTTELTAMCIVDGEITISASLPPDMKSPYTMILCVSISDLDNLLESLHIYQISEPMISYHIRGTHLQEIKNRSFVRLCLSVEFQPIGSPTFSANIVLGSGKTLEFHYMEIRPWDALGDADEVLVIPFKVPRQSLQVMSDAQPNEKINDNNDLEVRLSEKEPILILALGTSGCGTRVATLSRAPGWVYVDLWEIEPSTSAAVSQERNIETDPSLSQSKSLARMSFELKGTDVPESDIRLSWRGDKIALTTDCEQETSFPLTVMEVCPFIEIDILDGDECDKEVVDYPLATSEEEPFISQSEGNRTGYSARGLQLSQGFGHHLFLKEFYGMSTFHVIDEEEYLKDGDELFLACDGADLGVYVVQEKWVQLYKLRISPEKQIYTAILFIHSVHQNLVATVGIQGMVILVDILSGQEKVQMVFKEAQPTRVCIFPECGMVAVSSEKMIRFYCLETGIELKVLRDPDGDLSIMGRIANTNHLWIDTFSSEETLEPFGKIVEVPSLKVVDTFFMSSIAAFLPVCSGKGSIHVPALRRSRLDLFALEDILLGPKKTAEDASQDGVPPCGISCFEPENQTLLTAVSESNTLVPTNSAAGLVFKADWHKVKGAQTLEVLMSTDLPGSDWKVCLTVVPPTQDPENDVKEWNDILKVFFEPTTARIIVFSVLWVQIWSMPTSMEELAELMALWQFDVTGVNLLSFSSCSHGRRYYFRAECAWMKTLIGTETFSFTVEDGITGLESDETRWALVVCGISAMPRHYATANAESKAAYMRYLDRYINEVFSVTEGEPMTVLNVLCHTWTMENRVQIKNLVRDMLLLPKGGLRWLPMIRDHSSSNPVIILLRTAEEYPKAIGLLKIFIEYLLQRTQEESNMAFAEMVLGSMNRLIQQCPEIALHVLQSLAFIPSRKRSAIVQNHAIASGPTLGSIFRSRRKKTLSKSKDPVLKFQWTNPERQNPPDYSFTQDLYPASFAMLWSVQLEGKHGRKVMQEGEEEIRTNWFKTFFHLLWHTCTPHSWRYVVGYEYELEHLDNPAMEALIQYKWNTLGHRLWATRFLFQCIFYILVIVATTMQVYYPDPEQLYGIFVAIVSMAAVFIWLEYPQFREHPSRYLWSPYNYLDMLAFICPAVSSILQILNIVEDKEHRGSRGLSFSVLIVSLHLLSELRINKSVCKYVTIVLNVMGEIKVFFIVFAMGILAFALAILHMLHGRSIKEADVVETSFPNGFWKAVSATYFMVGGRYDSIANLFEGGDVAFHVMMMFYFFFTVILMLNVLIALINIAFNKGDESWRLVWLQNRLRYAETAENMTYHVPGFRNTHDWFPKEIYYTATHLKAREYRKKQSQKLEQEQEELKKRKYNTGIPSNVTIVQAVVKAPVKDVAAEENMSGHDHAEDTVKSHDCTGDVQAEPSTHTPVCTNNEGDTVLAKMKGVSKLDRSYSTISTSDSMEDLGTIATMGPAIGMRSMGTGSGTSVGKKLATLEVLKEVEEGKDAERLIPVSDLEEQVAARMDKRIELLQTSLEESNQRTAELQAQIKEILGLLRGGA